MYMFVTEKLSISAYFLKQLYLSQKKYNLKRIVVEHQCFSLIQLFSADKVMMTAGLPSNGEFLLGKDGMLKRCPGHGLLVK